MKKIETIILFVAISFTSAYCQQATKEFTTSTNEINESVEWLTVEQALEQNFKEPKKFMVDVYTDWCGWCKVLDQKTFSNKHVASYLNENYYPVKFNAEQKEDLIFLTDTFRLRPNSRTHDFAIALLNGQLSYPKVVFMEVIPGDTAKVNLIHVVAGFREAKDFHQIISFIGDNHYLTTKMDVWADSLYQSPF